MSQNQPKADDLAHMYDQKMLREEAYADDSLLDVRRRTHVLYTVDPVDFGRWTLERLPWRGDERVLDVGCGPADLLREMARQAASWRLLVGGDLSAGMVTEAAGLAAGLALHLFVGDAQTLPFSDGSFEVVMARHMLYHVPDIDRAVAEAVRVLVPGGRLLVTTNAAGTMPEYADLRCRAAERFPAVALSEMSTLRFTLEDAPAFLEPHLAQVAVHTLPGRLRFPSAQPFVDYFTSGRNLIMAPDHNQAEWQAVVDFARAEVEAHIARHGHFDVTKITGAVVGVKAG
jgi:SAM-dependent methyltransferase